MPHIKPAFEKVTPGFGSSILVKKHTENCKMKSAFWHFHPEIELVYVNKGQGKRHIGNHLSYFNNSQLILLGSNLPHHGFTDRLTSNGSETLIQFKPDFLGETFFKIPEMQNIVQLFERGKKGILFKPETKKVVGPKMENLVNYNGFDRIVKLLEILCKFPPKFIAAVCAVPSQIKFEKFDTLSPVGMAEYAIILQVEPLAQLAAGTTLLTVKLCS